MGPGEPQAGPLSDMPTRLEGLVLELVLMRSTDVDLRVSIGGVRRAWRAAAAAERRTRLLGVMGPFTLPVWYIKRAWPGADCKTRLRLLKTTAPPGGLWDAHLGLGPLSCNNFRGAAARALCTLCQAPAPYEAVAAWRQQLQLQLQQQRFQLPPQLPHLLQQHAAAAAPGAAPAQQQQQQNPNPNQNMVQILHLHMQRVRQQAQQHLQQLEHLAAAFAPSAQPAIDACALMDAAERGDLAEVGRALSRDPSRIPSLKPQLYLAAARGGCVEVLRWLRALESPCPWDVNARACTAAAKGGHLEALRWLQALDPACAPENDAYNWAAAGGHLDVLKELDMWQLLPPQLLGAGCAPPPPSYQPPGPPPWDAMACWRAACAGGHVHVMLWLAPMFGNAANSWYTRLSPEEAIRRCAMLSHAGPSGFIMFNSPEPWMR